MSAKELTFFLPKGCNKNKVLGLLVNDLGLDVLDISGNTQFKYQFLARRGEGRSILEMEFMEDAKAIIEELSDWDNPSREYKDILLGCRTGIILYYREAPNARDFIMSLDSSLGDASSSCIVDNGEGCLLRLSEVSSCIHKDKAWSWEREEFPELPSVAPSEWKELE